MEPLRVGGHGSSAAPKVYTKPWVALEKLRFKLQPPNTDIREMLCSPSEIAAYNRKHAAPGAKK